MITYLLVLAIAVALTAAVGGCGGGDDGSADSADKTTRDTTEASSSPTKAQFVEQASAICTRVKKEGLSAMVTYVKQRQGNAGQSKVELLAEAFQAAFLPKVQGQIDEIRALGVPEGDEEEVEAFLAAMQEGVDTAGEGSTPSPQLGKSFKRSGQLARDYGLEACAFG